MNTTVIYRTPDGRRHWARLTTDHPDCNYGCGPVVVYAGIGYSSADMAFNGIVFHAVDNPTAADALKKAGYAVVG